MWTRPHLAFDFLLTGNTLRLAQGYVEVRPLRPVPVKRISGGVPMTELLAPGSTMERVRESLAAGATQFVGSTALNTYERIAALKRTADAVGLGVELRIHRRDER